ncbi:MAG: transketolase [Euryarchaeota archaeon]|nr:transketolase [Euryarchaeota archaeon]
MTEHSAKKIKGLESKAVEIRKHVIKMVHAAGSGHPGGSLSSTDFITALYFEKLRHDPKDPQWPDRDRVIMSKGHSCAAWYAALAMNGYFPVEDLVTYRKINSHLQGHPSMRKTPGVDMSTGSEGNGLPAAVGMALAGKLDKKDYQVYCIVGDGECDEGLIWEAAMAAAHYKLDNLTVFLDRNMLQIDGPTEEIMSIEPIGDKWRSFRWNVLEIDGHDMHAVLEAVDKAKAHKGGPTCIYAHTVKGKGVSFMQGSLSFHGKAPSDAELHKALTELEQQEHQIAARTV